MVNIEENIIKEKILNRLLKVDIKTLYYYYFLQIVPFFNS